MTTTPETPPTEVEQRDLAFTPDSLLQLAVDKGADLDRLERLMDLKERWDKEQARKDFFAAFAAFKAEGLSVTKDKTVKYSSTFFQHASLENLTDTIAPALARHGMGHNFDVHQADTGEVQVTCTLAHEAGHTESVTLSGAPDKSGQKNPLQQVGSTIKYLSRYTLMAITGLAPEDPDQPHPVNDAHVANPATEVNPFEPDTLYEGRVSWCEERTSKTGKKFGAINIQTDQGDVEMTFWHRPEGIKDLPPEDWRTLEKQQVAFSFTAQEKGGKIWRNLATLDLAGGDDPEQWGQ